MRPRQPSPAKAAAAAPSTPSAIYDASASLESGTGSESDYRILLAGLRSAPDVKVVALQALSHFISLFPDQADATLSALETLTDDPDPQVRKTLFRELSKMATLDPSEVHSLLLHGLGDSDERIVQQITQQLSRLFQGGGPEFQSEFISSITSQSAEAQAKMINLVRENVTFSEDNTDQLLTLLRSAFKTNAREGLLLFRTNKNLLKEDDWQPLVNSLIDRFDHSLDAAFDRVIEHLLDPLLGNTKYIGDEAAGRLLNVVAAKILPKFAAILAAQQVSLVQGIADLANRCTSGSVLSALYRHVFLGIPKSASDPPINFSIVEGCLWAFLRLARRFPAQASKAIGTILVVTGQPGEADGATDDAAANAEFRARLKWVASNCRQFIDEWKARIQEAKKCQSEEARQQMIKGFKAVRTGNNTRSLCRGLLGPSPLSAFVPDTPSWWFKRRTTDTPQQGRGSRPGRPPFQSFSRKSGVKVTNYLREGDARWARHSIQKTRCNGLLVLDANP
jgi:hypothetical protein